jgi:exopolysaccharide biosynthesis polyprenyl glycosylphosphotransferase
MAVRLRFGSRYHDNGQTGSQSSSYHPDGVVALSDEAQVERVPATAVSGSAEIVPRPGYFRRRGAGLLLVLLDVATLVVLSLVFDQFDFGALLLGVFYIGFNSEAGLYRSRFTLSILNDLPLLAGRFLMATGLSTLVIVATHYTQGQAPILDWLGAFVALVAVRAIGYAFIRYMRSRRLIGKATLIVGCGMVGTGIAHALMRERSCGLEPIGFVDSPPPGMATDLPLPLLGPLPKLPELMAEYNVEYVLVAYTHQPESDLVGIIRSADRLPGGVAVVPRLFELPSVRGGTDVVSDIPLVRLRRPAFRSPFWPLKRAGDAVVAGLAIVRLSPLLLLIAALDRIVDGPGVIFRQERVGIDGRTIEVLKFRSLRPADPGESETKWNISNDNRVSWFGKLLRKSSLDELPQLFNILRGDMSIVGPRPERPHFVEQFGLLYPYYGSRHRVPCGLTGWAQIHGLRGDTSIAARARYDNFYIENWSIWLDIKIILRTVTSLTRGSG